LLFSYLAPETQRIRRLTTQRRAFFEHLITLPTYRDPTCTLMFTSLITRGFTEFEDLQDVAVDAVLDLCEDEDEQVRSNSFAAAVHPS
jgi:hypothetical protein